MRFSGIPNWAAVMTTGGASFLTSPVMRNGRRLNGS